MKLFIVSLKEYGQPVERRMFKLKKTRFTWFYLYIETLDSFEVGRAHFKVQANFKQCR